MTGTSDANEAADKSAPTGPILPVADSSYPQLHISAPDDHNQLRSSSGGLGRPGDLHKWTRSSSAHDRVVKGIRAARQSGPPRRGPVHWQTQLQRKDRMAVSRPIEPKPTTTSRLATLEQRVSETLDLRRSSQKDAEKARRDRLKEAFDRLTQLLPANTGNVNAPQMAADLENSASKSPNSRVGVVESAIGYITGLKGDVERLERLLDECQCRNDG